MDSKTYRILVLPTLVCVLASACGTFIHRTHQNVMINSDPPGATAQVGGLLITTPTSVSLLRNEDYIFNVEKEGCQRGQAQIYHRFDWNSTILGNALWAAPLVFFEYPSGLILYSIGVAVDFYSGGAWRLEPKLVTVPLLCQPES